MHMEGIVERSARRLQELAAGYSGWRFGLGGSGHWWAVRGNDFVRALSPEELEVKLEQHLAARQDG
ncbi:MAG: hypothetical protein JWR24_5680 [Actinoallomurus sp.]|jgi:hypothetical protein|nr:hypothetical protein [Actinoallomurus sp.]